MTVIPNPPNQPDPPDPGDPQRQQDPQNPQGQNRNRNNNGRQQGENFVQEIFREVGGIFTGALASLNLGENTKKAIKRLGTCCAWLFLLIGVVVIGCSAQTIILSSNYGYANGNPMTVPSWAAWCCPPFSLILVVFTLIMTIVNKDTPLFRRSLVYLVFSVFLATGIILLNYYLLFMGTAR